MRTVIFDLDGTLSNGEHRLHLLPSEEDRGSTEAWVAFNKACSGDSPILSTIRVARSLIKDYRLVILTGRGAQAEQETRAWLKLHKVPYHELIMRAADDHRKDIEFKEEVLRKIGLENIECAFDDLEHVVKHIRSLGITAYQVAHYDEPSTHTTPQPDGEEKEDGTKETGPDGNS